MNNHIITEPVGLMKKIALDALKNRWKDVFIAMCIYTILTGYVQAILNLLFPRYEYFDYFGQSFQYNVSFVGSLYETILTGAFMYGLALFMLTFFRTKKTDNRLLFEGFSMIGKTILLQIVITIFVFLWTLLLIVPGIIAACRYSMSFYILADHPEYSVMQCINESKARMKGNVGKYFLMILSFIGWAILAGMIQGLILVPFGGVAGLVVGNLISLIPMVYLNVYVKTTETVFYELLTQNLVVMVPDQHVRDNGVDPDNMVNANYEIHEETVNPEAKNETPEFKDGPADDLSSKAADLADDLADAVSDATDKIADIQDKVADKVEDFIPDSIEKKFDGLSDIDGKVADGAPDVPQQVYENTSVPEAVTEPVQDVETEVKDIASEIEDVKESE